MPAGRWRQRSPQLVRGRAAAGRRCVLGLATGSTPTGVYDELVRLHKSRGAELRQRGDVQPGRVLPDAAGQTCRAITGSCGSICSTAIDVPGRNRSTSPTGRCPRTDVDAYCAAYERADQADAGGNRPAAAGDRPDGARGVQRAGERAGQPDAADHAGPGDPARRRQRLLRRAEHVPRRADHHGRGDDPGRPSASSCWRSGRTRPAMVAKAVEGPVTAGDRRQLPPAAPRRPPPTWTSPPPPI